MKARPARLLLLALFCLGACGTDGAPKFDGGPPTVEATFGQCAFCHVELATDMTFSGGHGSLDVKCQLCHDDLSPGMVGPGHRSVPACVDCHTIQQTHHDPATGTAQECLVCHTPHGSPNLFLIEEMITVPSGAPRPIDFTNLLGRADGSFASVSDPGSGLCEVCHTTTRFYDDRGTGEEHFRFACFTCHPHAAGFAER